MRPANLGLRFVLELCLLAAYAYLGGLKANVLGAILAPVAVAVIWALLVSPKARVSLSRPLWIAVQVVLFGGAVAGLAATGHAVVAALFGAVTVLNLTLVLYWHQSDSETTQVSA